MKYISGLFFRIEWLHISHLLALNTAQVAQSVRNTQCHDKFLSSLNFIDEMNTIYPKVY